MARGLLDQATLDQIDSRLPRLAKLAERVLSLSPIAVSAYFQPQSRVPVAVPCFHDAYHVCCEARYALIEAISHLVWYREKKPVPQERAAVWFARFYITAASSCLYAAAEDIANALVEMFELNQEMLDQVERTSLHAKVGAYLNKTMPTESVTRTVCKLGQSESWRKAMLWRNRWVHEQSTVKGLGVVYNRDKRWKEFIEVDGTMGVEMSLGGGDEPDYSVDEVLQFVGSAFEEFVRTFDEVVTCYSDILSKAAISPYFHEL